ncbi:ATP-binding cassette domain-containing protein [Alteromonas sp. KUL49]|uniref:ATP-binding cassette domain-containing protein n=1 Tax=Alteromonas sp. KUL49 TaxID=2480798 RepID=UPI00102EEED3|nr:ATP-binding cassette domain-containing protein [Alteromonas sp. KUL49]TAP42385.1 ATP-binding cassette domain-containing protein [Alteromonas sp. KUL49]
MTTKQEQTLSAWFKQFDRAHQLSVSRQLAAVGLVRCLSLVFLILGFYFFALGIHTWIVHQLPFSSDTILKMALCFLVSWLIQGGSHLLVQRYKQGLLIRLEHQLARSLAWQQHALIRQQSPFYWQSLWLKHIPSLVNWCFEYRVQQLVATVMPLLVLAVIFSVNYVIGIGLIFALPVVPLFMIIVGKGAASQHKKHFTALNRLGSLFADRLNALPLLASYQAHNKQSQLLTNASTQLNERTMKVVSVAFLSNTVLDFFATLSVALVAVFIGFTLLGELKIGPEISLHHGLWILLTVPLLLSEMKRLGQVYHQKAEVEAARAPLDKVFGELPPSNHDKQERFTHFFTNKFSVDGLLTGTNVSVTRGDKIRVCGKSGTGKTVLLEALAGQRLASAQLAGTFVWIHQSPLIMPGSLRSNLTVGRVLDDNALRDALHQVELTAWFEVLPKGLDTIMSNYPALSGGEAQRLSLARALLSNADIWFLDEPTAHLPENQHHRLSALIATITRDKTVFWASHKYLPANYFSQHWIISNKHIICCPSEGNCDE